jgi:glycosyltransferase involved in cell wall biosynthesis
VISVIVPVRNGLPWLDEQLRALVEQECSEPWEVVVADNGSTDETRSVVQEWAARVDMIRLVDASTVRGPGAARNAGVRAARGELLAFCDADDVVQPGWLAGHLIALAGSDFCGGVYDYWSLNGRPAPSPPTYSLPSAVSQFGFLPTFTSGNLALHRRAFEGVGGFAEDLLTGEDIDLSWRLQLSGHRGVVTTDSVVARRDQSGFWKVLGRFITYGRSGPALYRRYRVDGLRRNLPIAAKTWVWLALTTPRLVRRDFRVRWASIAGWRTGRLLGSLQQRTFFP